jgi:hypothetical protein
MVLFFSAWLVVDTLSVSFIPLCNDVFVVGSPCVAAGGKADEGFFVGFLHASNVQSTGFPERICPVAGGEGK